MEWEYLLGYMVNSPDEDSPFKIVVVDRSEGGRVRATLDQLGLDRWELITGCSHDDDLIVIFKRQKLYPMGAVPIGTKW